MILSKEISSLVSSNAYISLIFTRHIHSFMKFARITAISILDNKQLQPTDSERLNVVQILNNIVVTLKEWQDYLEILILREIYVLKWQKVNIPEIIHLALRFWLLGHTFHIFLILKNYLFNKHHLPQNYATFGWGATQIYLFKFTSDHYKLLTFVCFCIFSGEGKWNQTCFSSFINAKSLKPTDNYFFLLM